MMKESKWIEVERKKVTVDDLIELLKMAREEFGGDVEIQAMGCYSSLGEINAVGMWKDNDWYSGVILATDVCSG
jgi:hypothetical protein